MSLSHGAGIVRNGLIFHFDAANSKSYPGTGYTWYELVKNRSVNISLGAYSSTNKGELSCPVGNEYFNFPLSGNTDLSYIGTSNFSIETLVRSDNVVYPRSRHPLKLFHTVTSTTTPGWSCGHTSAATAIQIICGDGTTNSTINIDTPDIAESTYYHRVFTISRSNGLLTKLYMNGNYIGQANATNVTGSIYNASPEDGSLLGFGNVWGWRYIGGINVIKLYDRILSDTEIQQNFEALRGRYGI